MAIKYRWVAERLELMIERQIQKGIHKLPTEQELCGRYRVSRQTVRTALKLLEQKGVIAGKQGSGYYITGRSAKPQGNVIGILISSDQEYIYPGVITDIRGLLSPAGFTDRIFTTDNSVSREREILLSLLKNPPRGLIVEGSKSALPNPNLDLYRRLMKTGCRIVFLFNYYPALPDCLCVKDDNYYGSTLLVQYLAAQGHREIGGIFKADDMQGVERYQGYMEAMRDLGLPLSDERVFWYGSRELDRLLHSRDTRFLRNMVTDCLSGCTAVVCYNDIIAYYLVDELLLAGYELPSGMAITAFDNTYFSNSDILTVTTLSHQPHEMGTRAAEAMIRQLSGQPVSSQEARWKLNLKESTQTQA